MTDDGEPTDRERACFEAGIKLGALYHQFVGMPLTEAAAPAVAATIEDSVGAQRHVEDVEVAIADVDPNRYGYDELTGTMLDVSLTVAAGDGTVEASLAEEDGYPMMRIDDVG